MSRKQHPDTRLKGWDGPFYPPLIVKLHDVLASSSANGKDLNLACQEIRDFVGLYLGGPCRASDGYVWYRLAEYKFAGDRGVRVGFPWWQDWQGGNETTADRSPALYLQGGLKMTDKAVTDLLSELVELIRFNTKSAQ